MSQIIDVNALQQYKDDYKLYAIYVARERMMSDARDGLKPVARKILVAAKDLNVTTKTVKSARIVGETMGKYHAHGDCVGFNTVLYLPDENDYKSIGDLYTRGVESISVLAFDKNTNTIVKAIAHDFRIGQITDTIYKIKFSDGFTLECTSNHPIMNNVMEYIQAKDIDCNFTPLILHLTGDLYIESISVETLKKPIPMYDFTVDGYENMLIPVTNKLDTRCETFMVIHNSSIYGTMKPMSNDFEIKQGLLTTQGAWGNKYGEEPSAMRYTEAMISPFAMDVLVGELIKYSNCVDWQPNFDDTILEPECLPAALPILLVNGSFGLGVGLKSEIPKHNLVEVIDETIAVIRDRSHRVKLIPDSCMNCEIIDTDFQEICDKGFGYFTVRGVIEDGVSPKGNPTIIVKSAPDLVYYETIDNAISKMVTNKKLINIISTNHQGNEFIVELKKGSDINYVKQMLFQHTDLQKNCRVSFEVLDKTNPVRMSYKAYILFWLEFRKFTKLRQYYAQLQDVNTEMHKLEPYIKLARSPKMNQIIDKIRKSKNDDEWLVEYLIKELDITDLQAKFIINLRMKNLSAAYLSRYVEAYDTALKEQEAIMDKIANDALVEADIISELEAIKAKYGTKRTCKIISKSTAIGIPQGEFTIIVTENNFLKKVPVNDTAGSFKNDKPKYIIRGENTESLLIFNEMAKVFKIPIHKIGFSDKRSNGIDIRFLLKNCTSNINAVMYEPILRKFMDKITKYYMVTLSAEGFIKKMDIDDFLSANTSGLMYAKLDPGDYIKDIMIIGDQSDVIVYTQAKALRFSMEEVPYLKRSTKGNKAIGGTDPVMGLSVVLPDTTDIVIITKKGYVNRIPVIAFQTSSRAKAPGKVIKLSKGDYIMGLYGLNANDVINVTTTESKYDIIVSDIPQGSSVSAGTKMIRTRGEEILYCYYQRKQG